MFLFLVSRLIFLTCVHPVFRCMGGQEYVFVSGCQFSFDKEVVQISISNWWRTCNTTHFEYPLKVKKHVEVG